MDFREIVRMGLEEYMSELRVALDGLTTEERRFQPGPASHHIDFAVWHMARVEDHWIQRFAISAREIWRRDGWHEKLGLPERGSGFGFKAEQVTNLPQFDIHEMMAYYESVRDGTFKYLDDVTPEGLERVPDPDRQPGYTIGRMFSHLIVEESQHVGQIAYLRGLQRGLGQ